MSRPEQHPGQQGKISKKPTPKHQKKPAGENIWRKPAVWAGSLMTAVLTGVLIATLSNQAQRVLPSTTGTPLSSVPAQPSATLAASGSPLAVLSEDPAFETADSKYEGVAGDQNSGYIFSYNINWSNSEAEGIWNTANQNPDSPVLTERLYREGAYEAEYSQVRLIVKNSRDYPIRITDVYVEKSCTSSLPTGTLLDMSPQGDESVTGLGFNLDANEIHASSYSVGGRLPPNTSPLYFSNKTISLQSGEQWVFDMVASTLHQACSFRYVFRVLDGNYGEISQPIGYYNMPFKVSAITDPRKYAVTYGLDGPGLGRSS
jgi:hypothetical protein